MKTARARGAALKPPVRETKDEMIRVRTTEEQKVLLDNYAMGQGLELGPWMRSIALRIATGKARLVEAEPRD